MGQHDAKHEVLKTAAGEVKQLREEIERLQHEIVELQRYSAIGQLLSTTAHEFNNVLMTVMNYAKMAIRNPDPAFRDKSLNRILTASQRACQITNSVLGMARNRGDQMEPTQLADLINESLILLEREMQKYRVQIELQLSPVPLVIAHGNQIQQVLLNMLINARQAMPAGGRLIIQLKENPSTNTVDLSIRDFGTGIAPEHLPRIFESRFTTKTGPDATGKGGSGLGLSTCRQIIQAHGGKIRVESALGQGTCFTIKIPAHHPAAAVPAPHFSAVQPNYLPNQPAGNHDGH
ncbi:MAG TPA: ATP-binding protein [Pirellulaceae bacterium]|nr:ATP-binding protein [Pirellulaceae bacterium]